jgi:imidazolonepropionase-like amidohydrolase
VAAAVAGLPGARAAVEGGASPAAAPGRALLVRAGRVIPVEGDPISPGAVLCRGGKVVALGSPAAVAADGAEVIDLGPHAVVLPGLVAVSSGLAAPGAGVPESVAPQVRALDGFDFFRPQRKALEGGVTTAYLDGARRRVIGGQGAVVKLAGASAEARTLKARAGLYGVLGDPSRYPPALFDAPSSPDPVAHPLLPLRPQSPGSRMAAVAMLREALARGKAAPEGGQGAADEGLAALAAVASGKEPLRLRADEAADLEAALALAKETGVKLVLAGARDSRLLADRLAGAGVSVALESLFVPGRLDDPLEPEDAEKRAAAMGNPAALEKAGVPFAIGAQDAALGDLLLVAAAYVRAGLAPERALRAVTLDAARILGVEDRVGSLAPGKDADLAAFSGDPFDLRSTAILTVVDGAVVFRREAAPGVLVLRAGTVHTGTGEVFSPGAVAIEDGKVVEVGPAVGIPPAARVVDMADAVILPGFVDSHSRLGLRSGGWGGPGWNLTMASDAAKAIVPDDPSFAAALGAGVTTTLVSPGGGGPVVGTDSVVKTAGGDMAARTLRETACVEVSLAGAQDLPAALQGLRDAIKGAQQYHEAWEKYEKEIKDYEKARKDWDAGKKKREDDERKAKEAKKDEPKKDEPKKEEPKEEEPPKAPAAEGKKEEKKDEARKDEPKKDEPKKEEPKKEEPKPEEPKEPVKPQANPAMDPWREVLRKKIPLLCRAASAAEIEGALKVVKEESKLALVLVQGDEAWRAAADLKKAEVGVLLGPRVVYTSDGKTVNGARALATAGVPFGFASDAGFGSRDLPMLAAYAVRQGLGPAAAVRALTLDAARLLGVADRVGSLEPGKDADLVILTGDPFAAATRVRTVYVNGKAVLGGE